jgi:hypothetical protein
LENITSLTVFRKNLKFTERASWHHGIAWHLLAWHHEGGMIVMIVFKKIFYEIKIKNKKAQKIWA